MKSNHTSCPFGKRPKSSFLFKTIVIVLFSIASFSQEKKADSTKINQLDAVLVKAIRATSKTPVSFSNLDKKDIKTRNLGQDIPILMNFMPSVVSTSDTGNGIGYTGIRVRGSDATRVNVTVNGIPYNDSESHGTFWVNMPDFASSVENIQLQRGVGTSTNGAGAFGASLNMLTDSYSAESAGEISNSFGSFNTRKHTVKFSTGLMDKKFEIAGRLSNIASDGFIDRAFSDLKGYFLQGTFVGKTTLIKALVFGGTERTYQSWFGLEDPLKLKNDRTYNPAGSYKDALGNEQFYDNETDNYEQNHYQLHWSEKWNNNWNSNFAFHYTKGSGYFEQFKEDESFSDYNWTPFLLNGTTINQTDLVRRRWLDNHFYGTTFSVNYKNEKADLILGGGLNKYDGAHFGEVIWTKNAFQNQIRDRYYSDNSVKTDFNLFAKLNYDLNSQLNLYGDLQIRKVNYQANAVITGNINDSFSFFNPKAGLSFTLNKSNKIYFSYAKANREPNRDDYENGKPVSEQLDDFELGWRFSENKVQINVNGYYMKYKNQLVLTGQLNNVGAPIRENVGNSFRVGIETDATVQITEKWLFQFNCTLSQSKNQNFVFRRDGILENLGQTNIAFSPEIIAANRLVFRPTANLNFSLLSKFVGDQFMGNINAANSKLKNYFVNDINISYEWKPKTIFKTILISGLFNNIFNLQYENNGYFYTYDDDFSVPNQITTIEGAGFYPQAGTHFLMGLTLAF